MEPTPASAPSDSETASRPDTIAVPASAIPSAAIQWNRAMPAVALASLVAALAVSLGLVVWVLGVLAAGFLSVVFYRRRTPLALITAGTGARLGAVAGIVCFGMTAVLAAIEVALFHQGAKLRSEIFQALEQAASRNSDPQVQAMVERFKTPEGLALLMVFVLFFGLLAFILLSSAGGALGAAVLRRSNRT